MTHKLDNTKLTQAKIILGSTLLIAGNLAMMYSTNYVLLAVICTILGAIIVFRTIKQAKRESDVKLTRKQLKSRFYIMCGAIIFGIIVEPFISPNNMSFQTQLLVSVGAAVLALGIIYWVFLVKLWRESSS